MRMQRRLVLTKAFYKLFYSACTKTTYKPSKVAIGKKISSSVYVIGRTCFDKCFLFHVTTGRHCSL